LSSVERNRLTFPGFLKYLLGLIGVDLELFLVWLIVLPIKRFAF